MRFEDFAANVLKEYNKLPGHMAHAPKKKGKVNELFHLPQEHLPSNPELVIERCQQIKAVADKKGNVDEPLWYATLGVIRFCVDGVDASHRISAGHPKYSHDETERKIEQLSRYGPTTCATFNDKNPTGCDGCPHRGKITSPITLGVHLESKPTSTIEQAVVPPPPFKRTERGVVQTTEEAGDLIIYPYDLYITEIARDAQGGFDVVLVKHVLPIEGTQEFAMRASDVAEKRLFNRDCADNSVRPSEQLRSYVDACRHAFHETKERRLMHSSMGWKGDSFVLGGSEYTSAGRVRSILTSPAIRSLEQALRSMGDSARWITATEVFARPGMEAHAFMFGLGFASPLMKFTGIEGCMFNAIGDTSSGKTLMGRMLNSIYGDWHGLVLKKQDTENAKVQFFGSLGSLPVYTDEITNILPETLSEFVYEATSGRSKRRLKETGDPRATLQWQLIAVCSSNSSVVDKLRSLKSNPEAELARVFEFNVSSVPALDFQTGKAISETISEHYGTAGVEYIKYIVTHQKPIQQLISQVITHLQEKTGAPSKERFLLAGCACVIVGLRIASLLGLILFDPRVVNAYIIDFIKAQRAALGGMRLTPLDLLGAYLNANIGYCVTVEKQAFRHKEDETGTYNVVKHPQGAIHARYDLGLRRLWIDQRAFNIWLQERQERMLTIRKSLEESGVLKSVSKKTLGFGTGYASSQVVCWELDMANPLMGNATVQLVDSTKTVQQHAA